MNIKDILGGAGKVNVQNMNVFVMPTDEKVDDKVVNPGIEYGEDGKAKWSPPLQQQINVTKDAVGPTTDDTTDEPTPEEAAEAHEETYGVLPPDPDQDSNLERIKQLASILTPNAQKVPSG